MFLPRCRIKENTIVKSLKNWLGYRFYHFCQIFKQSYLKIMSHLLKNQQIDWRQRPHGWYPPHSGSTKLARYSSNRYNRLCLRSALSICFKYGTEIATETRLFDGWEANIKIDKFPCRWKIPRNWFQGALIF